MAFIKCKFIITSISLKYDFTAAAGREMPHQKHTALLHIDLPVKALSDQLCKMPSKVALNFACVKCSELEMVLSTAFYAANYAGLNTA